MPIAFTKDHAMGRLAWRLSSTMEVGFWLETPEEALSKGRPEIFNTDQSLP